MRSLENASPAIEYRNLGCAQKALFLSIMLLEAHQWKEGQVVMPMQVGEGLLGGEFYMCDFGLAFQAGTSVSQTLQGPAYYQAPE